MEMWTFINRGPYSRSFLALPPPVFTGLAAAVQGYLARCLAHKKRPNPLGPSQDPRYRPTVGSYGVAVSLQRGTPVI